MPRRRPPPRPGALADLDPIKITTQIVLVQAWYYIGAAVLFLFTAIVWGHPISWGLVLDWRTVRRDVTFGWVLALVWLMNALFGAIVIFFIVARSKLVLDFALTAHFLHLIFTSLYTHSIPSDAFWWIIQTLSASAMILLATWICQRRELQPLSFGGPSARRSASGSRTPSDSIPMGVLAASSRARSRSKPGGTSSLGGAGGAGTGGPLLRTGDYDLEQGAYEMTNIRTS